MPRTKEELVKGVLGRNYDQKKKLDLNPFIATANSIVSRCVTMAAGKNPPIVMSDADLELVERWLSAHLYAVQDPLFTNKSTEGASGAFQTGQLERGLGSTVYGQTAMDIDYSGCLKNIVRQQRAGGFWGGKTESQTIPWDQRN